MQPKQLDELRFLLMILTVLMSFFTGYLAHSDGVFTFLLALIVTCVLGFWMVTT